jgi:hypothetical protein
VFNITPRPLYPRGEKPQYPWNWRLGKLRKRSELFAEEKNFLPLLVFDPRTVQTVATSYTDYVVSNEWGIIGTGEIAD